MIHINMLLKNNQVVKSDIRLIFASVFFRFFKKYNYIASQKKA